MILFILTYLGGALTVVGACILPLPSFLFARADGSFLTSGLPMLIGTNLQTAGRMAVAPY